MATTSWVTYDADHPFPIQNIPFGVFQAGDVKHCCTAIGDFVVDLHELAVAGVFSPEVNEALKAPTLNDFMALERKHWTATRKRIQELLSTDNTLKGNEALKKKVLRLQTEVTMVLPCNIGDYTDFYSSREHATNLGKLFRPDSAPLLPNWLHIPVGYHGRASSIVPSGTPVRRPLGQMRPDDSLPPVFGKCKLLDMELEVAAYFGGPGNPLGEPIPLAKCRDHIFGLSLFNDWSARDIQKWEYVPLGPFLGKSFHSTVSPWIVTVDALEPFLCEGPTQGEGEDPTPLPYLQQKFPGSFDIHLSASLRAKGCSEEVTLTNTNFKYMYWSVYQQLAHHTINGCPMRPGDVLASGTISGKEQGSYGSMLEITWRGTQPVKLPNGEERKFFQDGDSVMLHGYCQGDGFRIGFGPCEGTIIPAPEM